MSIIKAKIMKPQPTILLHNITPDELFRNKINIVLVVQQSSFTGIPNIAREI